MKEGARGFGFEGTPHCRSAQGRPGTALRAVLSPSERLEAPKTRSKRSFNNRYEGFRQPGGSPLSPFDAGGGGPKVTAVPRAQGHPFGVAQGTPTGMAYCASRLEGRNGGLVGSSGTRTSGEPWGRRGRPGVAFSLFFQYEAYHPQKVASWHQMYLMALERGKKRSLLVQTKTKDAPWED